MRRHLAPLLALALSGPARGDDVEWEVRGELGGGADSNPRRLAGPGAGAAAFSSALVEARAVVEGDGRRAAVKLSEAGRVYLEDPQANAVGSRLEMEVRHRLGAGLAAGASLRASDLRERSGVLDQGALAGKGSLSWEGEQWGADLAVAWSLFAPRQADLRPFASQGPELTARLSRAASGGHTVAVGLILSVSEYGAWPVPRRDEAAGGSAGWAYRGSLLASASYDLTASRSTVAGGAFQRHRLAVASAFFLPGEASLAFRARLQWSRYPEPLYLEQQLLLDGGESQDSVEARLAVPLGGPWELALSFGRHWSEAILGGTGPAFGRTVGALTLGFRQGASFTMGTP